MNSKMILILVIAVFFSGVLVPAFADTTGACGIEKKDIIKSVIAYITQKSDINKGQVMVLIRGYLGSLNCGSTDLAEARQKADDITDDIVPKCSDGTLFAHCSYDKPKYCYSGKLVDRCDLCCDTGKCTSDGQCEPVVNMIDCTDVYGSGFFCGTYSDWEGQCLSVGQIEKLSSYDRCSDVIDGAQYCIKCEPRDNIINCAQQYGDEYWCSTYDEWKRECNGSGQAIELTNAKCYKTGGIFNDYCSKCAPDEPSCHLHTNPSWLETNDYDIQIIEKGCTDSFGTEHLVEIREKFTPGGVDYCGERVWVWLEHGLNPLESGKCYRVMINTNTVSGHVITGVGDEKSCPVCENTNGSETYTFALHAGENMVSFPVIPSGGSVAEIFGPIESSMSIVWAYDASDTANHWKNYDPSVPFGNDLLTISPGVGYIVLMNTGADLVVTGGTVLLSDSDVESKLVAGSNLVGPGNSNAYLNAKVGKWRYDTSSAYVESPTLEVGKGYWVDCDSTESNCIDGIDNDCDGLVDSADSDCSDLSCHTHTNPAWIDDGTHKIKIVDIGCTQMGCAEGDYNGTEVLIELREGAFCGEQVWVWLDTMMSPNAPDIGSCYIAEIFTDMYGPVCGHVVRYLMSTVDCPDCEGNVTGYGDSCAEDAECNPPLVCQTSGRYDKSSVYTEEYCCHADECASVINGPCVNLGGTDIKDAEYPGMVLECVFNNDMQRAEYIVDCDGTFGSGFWCGTYSSWQEQCVSLGEIKELSSPGCSLGISEAQYCIKCA